jgi:hypothetical protein
MLEVDKGSHGESKEKERMSSMKISVLPSICLFGLMGGGQRGETRPTARISTYHQLWIHKLMMVPEISAVG